jgi:hypothetical protein
MFDLSSLLGVFLSNLNYGNITTIDGGTNLCCPDCSIGTNNRVYIISSVETFLKYFEASEGILSCCTNLYASVETTLKFTEAFGSSNIPNNYSNCPNDFDDCINSWKDSLTPSENENLLGMGIVEYSSLSGHSQVCRIREFVDLAFNNQGEANLTKSEITSMILNTGFVINCDNNELIVSSVETYLKWLEAQGGGGPVPA